MVWLAVIRFCAGLLGCGFVVFGFVVAVCLCVGCGLGEGLLSLLLLGGSLVLLFG